MSTPVQQRSGSTGWRPVNRAVNHNLNSPIPVDAALQQSHSTHNNNSASTSTPVQRASSNTVHNKSPAYYVNNRNEPQLTYSPNNPYTKPNKHGNNSNTSTPNTAQQKQQRPKSGRKSQFTKVNLFDPVLRTPAATHVQTDQSADELQQYITTITDPCERYLWQSIVAANQLSTSGYMERYAIIKILSDIVVPCLHNINYAVELEPFGSLSAKIALVESDIDIALRIYKYTAQFQLQNDEFPSLNGAVKQSNAQQQTYTRTEITHTISRDECEQMLKHLAKRLRRNYSYVLAITKSATQLVTVKHRLSEELEIDCDFKLYHQNDAIKSHLLQHYVKCDTRVQPFITCIKTWARRRDLNDASRHTLNSFTLVNMAIVSLQTIVPPVVPVLPTQIFVDMVSTDVNVAHRAKLAAQDIVNAWRSTNTCNILELLKHFFAIYSVLDNNKHMPSIRHGAIVDRPPLEVSADGAAPASGADETKEDSSDVAEVAEAVVEAAPVKQLMRDTVGPSGEGRKRNEFAAAIFAVRDPFDDNSNPARAVNLNGWAHIISELQRGNRIMTQKNDPRQSPKSGAMRAMNGERVNKLQPITDHSINELTASVSGVTIGHIDSATADSNTNVFHPAASVNTAVVPEYQYITDLFQQTRWIAPQAVKKPKKKSSKPKKDKTPTKTAAAAIPADTLQTAANLQTTDSDAATAASVSPVPAVT